MSVHRSLSILGTRGVPAQHGGFETFCERFALHLAEHGWRVTVYCQIDTDETGPVAITEDEWRGVHRVNISVRQGGALGTMIFDAKATLHAAKLGQPALVLGYNTALLNLWLKLHGVPVMMNMDGIEWKRSKWSPPARAWLLLNELAGAWLSNKLVADHPLIADHLATRRRRSDIVMIPYGADAVDEAPTAPIRAMGLELDGYFLAIGRIEPENSVLEIVRAFSRRRRGFKLVVLGKLMADSAYHQAVQAAASEDVVFPGAIYEKDRVSALRRHARAYCHGHTVGGTNPSLVEALGAGNAVIAHGNGFNRWVAGPDQSYFLDEDDCDRAFDRFSDDAAALASARAGASARFHEEFEWPKILDAYEQMVVRQTAKHSAPLAAPTAKATSEA